MRRWPSSGMKRGSRAVVLMMNHALVYPVFQGIFRSGATAIPVMPQAAAAELRYVLADTEANFVVTDVERLADGARSRGRDCRTCATSWCKAARTIARPVPSELGLDGLLQAEPETSLPEIDRQRHRDHALLVRHDRPAQGRAAVALQPGGQRRGGAGSVHAR